MLFSRVVGLVLQRRAFSTIIPTEKIRNIAIIAHVDHGKTTLVDQLLRQSGTIKHHLQDTTVDATTNTTRIMDSNDLERERGITILSKCTSITYNDHLINIVDTPGHADFGGEVERVLSMVDGVALVVDATEGPMTQTRFVLGKALKHGLKPIVVLNKADRPTARPAQVESDIFDLFATLGATDEQFDYPVLYTSAKLGWAQTGPPQSVTTLLPRSMTPLFNTILTHIPSPPPPPPAFSPPSTPNNTTPSSSSFPFSMLTTQLEPDPYLGPLSLGRIHSGTIRVGDTVSALLQPPLDSEGKSNNKSGAATTKAEGKVKKIFRRRGVERVELSQAGVGEIVSVAVGWVTGSDSSSSGAGGGAGGAGVGVTLASPDGWGEEGPRALPSTPIDPPTISILIYPNDSPLAGQSPSSSSSPTKKLTTQLIRERLHKESLTNVALLVLPGPTSDCMEVRGRGVLHLGVLLETLRREGYEVAVGPPRAVMIPDPDYEAGSGEQRTMLEPVEECTIVVKEEYAGKVVEKLTLRKGVMVSYDAVDEGGVGVGVGDVDVDEGVGGAGESTAGGTGGWVRVVMDVPARGLIGYMAGEFKNDVHGQGTINHIFKAYEPYRGPIDTGRNGALISMAAGEASAYAMAPLQARGTMFIRPGDQVYPGMILGETSKPQQDLYINPCTKKQLTNIRAAGADEKIVISSPRVMTLEECLAYVGGDELVEVTPGERGVRLRKVVLDMGKRRALERKEKGKGQKR